MNPGQRIGPFEILSLLGRGGMGEVFLSTDTRLDRKVAIKILPAEFASDRQRLCRFEQEAKTLAALDHPNILSIFEVGTHEGAPYLVSQFLEGNTLRGELKNGALPQRKAIDYALQIANGLAAAHAKGIIHRDLKPENIFITSDGRAKILAFGLAKLKAKTGQSFNSTSNVQRPTPNVHVLFAEDTRLNGKVDIEILPHELSSSSNLKQRLEREAKTISNLSHPHIGTLHDVGGEHGVDYLVIRQECIAGGKSTLFDHRRTFIAGGRTEDGDAGVAAKLSLSGQTT